MADTRIYTVGWICAVQCEHVAAQEFLDEIHNQPPPHIHGDPNTYTLGRIGPHNVVVAVLPAGQYGTNAAAVVANNMLRTFPNIKIALMVGIAGGAPGPNRDIRLGDLVISQSIQQHDYGKVVQGKPFHHHGLLSPPPQFLLTAATALLTTYTRNGHQLDEAVNAALRRNPRLEHGFSRPTTDVLYAPESVHVGDDTCARSCSQVYPQVERRRRRPLELNPAVYHGAMASGNQVIKDANFRDKIANDTGTLCFEMEAAGLMNHFPCLVIRGICDYADSHKNKEWQGYAAMIAAAYAKDLLCTIEPTIVEEQESIKGAIAAVHGSVQQLQSTIDRKGDLEILDWIAMPTYEAHHRTHSKPGQQGTCHSLIGKATYNSWLSNPGQTLFCAGIPGSGKTTLTSMVIDYLRAKQTPDGAVGVAFVYCSARRKSPQSAVGLLRDILRQLASRSPHGLPPAGRQLYEKHRAQGSSPTVSEVLKPVMSLLASSGRSFIMVDALDECDCLEEFVRILSHLSRQVKTNIFATSRTYQSIENLFVNTPRVDLRAADQDVRRYIHEGIRKLPEFIRRNADLQAEIVDVISGAADGRFLVAQLSLNELKRNYSVADVRQTLRIIGLNGPKADTLMYENAVKRLGVLDEPRYHDDDGDILDEDVDLEGLERRATLAQRVLYWIMMAARPLTELELRVALSVDPESRAFNKDDLVELDLTKLCQGLVLVEPGSGIIRLTHQSVDDFLWNYSDWGEIWAGLAEADILEVCLAYLSFDAFAGGPVATMTELNARLRDHPFYDYAAQHWGHHAVDGDVDYQEGVSEFLPMERHVRAAAQVIHFKGEGLPAGPGTAAQKLLEHFHIDDETVNEALAEAARNYTTAGQGSGEWGGFGNTHGRTPRAMAGGGDPRLQGAAGGRAVGWGGQDSRMQF